MPAEIAPGPAKIEAPANTATDAVRARRWSIMMSPLVLPRPIQANANPSGADAATPQSQGGKSSVSPSESVVDPAPFLNGEGCTFFHLPPRPLELPQCNP